MTKQVLVSLAALVISSASVAHDGGHGPKLSDTGKYGGLVSPVVAKSESSKGEKAALIYKAELVRSADGNVSIYLYDSAMKPLDIKSFNGKATAILGAKTKGKWKEAGFELVAKDKAFEGKMPKPHGKPYNIDVTIKEKDKELLSAFDNLD